MLKNFLQKIRSSFELVKSMNDSLEKDESYVKMTSEEVAALPDEELYDAVQARVWAIEEKYDNVKESLKNMTDTQRAFYIVAYYDMEVQNGGLCQFFVNSSRKVAPMLSEALEKIGADKHKELFDNFISDNKINVSDLNSFEVKKVEEFEKQMERYPFDEFDDIFYETEPLYDCLEEYLKVNRGDL